MERNKKDVPQGWQKVSLEEVLEYEQPYKYTVLTTNYSNKSGIPVLTAGKSFILGYTEETEDIYCHYPVVIFDDFTTDSKFVDFPFKVKSSAMKFLKPRDEDALNLRFVFEIIQTLKIKEIGGDHKRRWISEFSKREIQLPPIAEQRQIAAILSKVDQAIEQTEQLIAKYRRIKTGLMQDLLTRGIDEHGRIRREATHQFKDSPLGRIPAEWEVENLNALYDLKSGVTPLRSVTKYFSTEGYNWVKTLDLNEGVIHDTEEKVTEYALQSTSLRLMPINSILIAMYGGWEQIGRTGILKKEAGTNQAITCLFNPRKELVSEYIQLFLQQNRWRWKQYAVSTRKDPNITKTDIENFLVAFPKSGNEQRRIANSVRKVKDDIEFLANGFSKLQSLKTGLMQDLLSGKVRVNHLVSEPVGV